MGKNGLKPREISKWLIYNEFYKGQRLTMSFMVYGFVR